MNMAASAQRRRRADEQCKQLADEHALRETVEPRILSSVWAPTIGTAFKLLLSIRLTSAVWSNISDCDETYNYWEPAHYLLYGNGFQTWEYSPLYAIRSYAYLYLHLLPVKALGAFVSPEKVPTFYLMRCVLALACAVAETYFYRGVLKHFGAAIARLTLALLLLSTGMFISSAAFLPSSFSMYMTLISMGAWYQGHLPIAIISTAVSVFLGWPFAGLLGLPIAIDVVVKRRRAALFAGWSLFSVVAVLFPVVFVDSASFGKAVVAPLNIVLYNVLTDHGPDLYGTEPWTFYFINAFLNFNVVFLFALSAFVVLLFLEKYSGSHFPGLPYWLTLMPMYSWMLIFFTQAHKEERFLFPIYPLFCLAAALSVDAIQRLSSSFAGYRRHYTTFLPTVPLLVLAVHGLLSVSRVLALYQGYHAPFDVYTAMYNVSSDRLIHTVGVNKPVTVCVGKEWYRYTSSFFLPNDRWHLKFLKSKFKGQLPSEYSNKADAMRIIPEHMNNMNKEESSRYVSEDRCHYIIDLDLGKHDSEEPNYSQDTERWQIVYSSPFLDSARSHPVYRAFYIPILSEKHCVYGSYNLLKARRRKNSDIDRKQ